MIHNLIGTSFLSPDTNDVFAYMPGNFANIERIALVDPQGHVRDYFDGLNNDVAGRRRHRNQPIAKMNF